MASTNKKNETPQLTRRAALTKPPGAFPHITMFCLSLLILLGCTSCSGLASQLDSSFFITRKQMISPGYEWAIFRGPDLAQPDRTWVTQMRLCLTENSGKLWKDITPAIMPAQWIETVFFLDRYHAWMFASDAQTEDPDARFYLLSTADGGEHWQTQEFSRQPYDLMLDMFPTWISFSDAQHGWILWHWHMMNSSRESLLSTTDGGKTWKRLPDPLGAGPMDFVSSRDGWLICASESQQGIPFWEDDALCATHDGGKRWKRVALPISHQTSELRVSFGEVRFKNVREGFVTGGVYDPSGTTDPREFVCRTRSGGRKWSCSTLAKESQQDE